MTVDFATQRANMVASQVRTQDVTDPAILEAMRRVPRETLVPRERAFSAYADAVIEGTAGRPLLRPRDVAKLLQALRPRRGEDALAIAAPYAAAVLEAVGLTVTELADGDLRAPAGAFDVIICESAVVQAPEGWLAALKVGGRLGVVERDGPSGRAMLYLRSPAAVGARDIFDATAPFLPGFEPKRPFALEADGRRRPGAS
jgi:protein-L-isoaspartate(D-aspartate) O-methyltransferase